MDGDIVGNRGQRAAEAVEQLLVDRRLDIAAGRFRVDRLVEACPATAEPIGFVRLITLAGFKLLFKQVVEFIAQSGRITGFDHAFVDQLVRI